MSLQIDDKRTLTFDGVEAGGCFIFEGEPFMKIYARPGENNECKAVCFSGGGLYTLKPDAHVERVNAKLVLED